jgi:hypothetical protein
MTALLKEGHSIDEFSIGFKRRKAAAASAERPVAKKVRKIARKRAG